MSYQTLLVEEIGSVIWCKLNRPEVRNAFNPVMIEELAAFGKQLPSDARAVVLCGEGPVFSAGGDLNWMKQSLDLDRQQNLEDARKLAGMLLTLDRIPVPLVGLIHGAAMGGGIGLVAICDVVIASPETQFSFSEVRLGIVPACIAPFVLRKIGSGHARALFTTAEKFSAEKAMRIGLVHHLVPNGEELRRFGEQKLREILQNSPAAIRVAKKLIFDLLPMDKERQELEMVAEVLATIRVSDEGQEGLRAFLEKRKPWWMKE